MRQKRHGLLFFLLLACNLFLMGIAATSSFAANYTIVPMAANAQVVKGQWAEFVLKTTLTDGFTTAGGINFDVIGLPPGTFTFDPVPIKRSGGVVLRINTTDISAGSHALTITTTEASSSTQTTDVTLEVSTTNVGSFSFFNSDGITPGVVTSLDVTGQKQLYISASANDSNGNLVSGLVLTSSNPSVMGTYKNNFGGYDIYAHQTGSANLVATAPDGALATLPLTVTVPSTSKIDIALTPPSITNSNNSAIQLVTNYTFPADQSYSSGVQGAISLTESTLTFGSNPPPYTYGGSFKVDHSQTQLGTYLFYGTITAPLAGPELYKNVAPLTITNDDQTYSRLNLALRPLDPTLVPMMYGNFTVEFYGADGTLQFSKSNYSYAQGTNLISFIGAITPGNYKIKISFMFANLMPQWYPNADTFADAQLINFIPGATLVPRYVFVRTVPTGTGSISGRVTVGGTNGIAGLYVIPCSWNGTTCVSKTPVATDSNGYFTLSGLAAGQYKVSFLGPPLGYPYQWYNGVIGLDSTAATVITLLAGQSISDINANYPATATAPGPPVINSVIPWDGEATVNFDPPLSNGGSNITGYTVTTNPGNISTPGTASPIKVTGLTNGTTYTFTVTATNTSGTSIPSHELAATPAFAPFRVGTTGYATFSDAYSSVSDGGIITALSTAPVTPNPLTMTRDIIVNIAGGYNSDYSAVNGFTTVPGKLVLQKGTTRLKNVTIK